MKTTEPIARKEYKCDLCEIPIKKGEKHFVIITERDDWMYPEDLDRSPRQTIRRHFDCEESHKILCDFIDEYEIFPYFYLGRTLDNSFEVLTENFHRQSDLDLLKKVITGEHYELVANYLKKIGIVAHSPDIEEAI